MLIESSTSAGATAIRQLERRLRAFYDGNVRYYDRAADGDKSHFFRPVVEIAKRFSEKRGRVNVLEIGAGRSELPTHLHRAIEPSKVGFVAQDINDTNRSYYEAKGIPLVVQDIQQIPSDQTFDVIASFFVWEHLTQPAQCLDKLCSLLSNDGKLIIVSPKYTFPLYIPPAIRHLPRPLQLLVNARLVLDALLTRVTHRPRFRVVADPALFHRSWRRDLDAVHMVSPADLQAHLGRSWRVRRLRIDYESVKAHLLWSRILLTVVIDRCPPTRCARSN